MRSWSKSLSWRFLRGGVLWPIVIWSLQGCVPFDYFEARMQSLQDDWKTASNEATAQSHRIGRIEEFLTYCPDEVQKLVGRVEKECESNETCTLSEADIRIEVRKVAPWQGARFQSLMQDRKHAAFFMTEDGRDLQDVEKKMLRDLVMPAWLDDGARKTRFLVVSHAPNNAQEQLRQASKRGKYVIKELKAIAEFMGKAQAAVPSKAPEPTSPVAHAAVSLASEPAPAGARTAESLKRPEAPALSGPVESKLPHYILHWALPYPKGGELPKVEDRPRTPGEKLTTSVFVYRVDC